MKRILVVILMTVNLSGCAGFVFSKNSDPMQKDVSSKDPLWNFGIHNAAGLRGPTNGTQRYDEEVEWCGLTIWVIIPIPLWLPVCHSYKEVTFENGLPIKRADQYLDRSGFLCGPGVYLAAATSGSHAFCSYGINK